MGHYFQIPLLVFWVTTSVPLAVNAQEPKPPEEPSALPAAQPTPSEAESLSHRYQIGVGVRTGSGYRVIVPYNEEFCGEYTSNGSAKKVCSSRQPWWLELSPSFGISQALEALVDIRLSLEQDFSKSRALFFAPGIKYYTEPDDLFKFYATGQVVFDRQQFTEGGPSVFDIGLRSVLGLQFDVLRYLGLYAQGGIVIGFKRWLSFNVDFAAGAQLRY